MPQPPPSSREDIRTYIRDRSATLRQSPDLLIDHLFASPQAQYDMRNRDVIPYDVFASFVEALFARFFVAGSIKHVNFAMSLGVNPLFALNMVIPYFLRIINNTLHDRTDQTVFEKVPSTRYYISYKLIERRMRTLLATSVYVTPLAFVPWEDISRNVCDIYGTFRDLDDTSAPAAATPAAALLADFAEARRTAIAAIKCRHAPLKKDLMVAIFHPDRIWKHSQAISMYSWDYLEMLR